VATAAELRLKPTVWYYRVRGPSSTLPTGARQPAWANQLSSLRRLSLSRLVDRADARTRTGDSFITREVKPFAEGWRRVAESSAEQGDSCRARSSDAPQPQRAGTTQRTIMLPGAIGSALG
jgi:hypothetical protein